MQTQRRRLDRTRPYGVSIPMGSFFHQDNLVFDRDGLEVIQAEPEVVLPEKPASSEAGISSEDPPKRKPGRPRKVV